MTRTSKFTTFGLLATLAATTLTPVLADSDSRQNTKNQWRNLGVVGAVIAGYGLLKGDQNVAALGVLGGGYAASRYETDRQHQSQDNSWDNYQDNNRRYYHTRGWQPPVGNNNDNRDNNSNRDNNTYDNRDQGRQGGRSRD